MSALSEKIAARYRESALRKIKVPEWDTTVYFKPVTTAELDAAAVDTPKDASPTRSNLQVVLIKALDADGKRLFLSDDLDTLVDNAEPAVINRIATEMFSVTSVEDAKKN